MSNAPQSTAEYDQVVTQWQIIISTQMHFNDMILRTRAIGSSVVLAAYGAAAVSLVQYPTQDVVIFDQTTHISVFVICFALSLLFSIFLIDVTYYYRLLLGVVEIGEELENETSSLISMTRHLSEKVNLCWANFIVFMFYAIPAAIGVSSLWYVIENYPLPVNTRDIGW